MIIQNILATADAIERSSIPKLKFDMETFCSTERHCGTRACIAGWALVVSGLTLQELDATENFSGKAAQFLGLNGDQAADLFLPGGLGDREFFTTQRAAGVLRHLARTGEVDWERFSSTEMG